MDASNQPLPWPKLSKGEHRELQWDRSLEAEDADLIPAVYHAQPSDLRMHKSIPLQQILGQCSELGRGPYRPARGSRHLTIAERRGTFSGVWDGPPLGVMAECGLCKTSQDSARCYCCDVLFRGLKEDTCIWSLHRDFAPLCHHLKRARAHGHRPKNKSLVRLVRQFSTNDSMGMA